MLWPRPSPPESTPWGTPSLAADPLYIPIDSNGNLTQKTEGTDIWGYEWNAENQLTRVTKNTVEQSRFSYDPEGRRVEKVAGGVTTTYTYDREDIIREVRGATTLKYMQGAGIDAPLAVDDGTTFTYLHADGLGSIAKVTNASGAVTLTRQYDAWGNPEVSAGEAGFAFTGREWDPEIGLYYYRARYYSGTVGRFISEDPIGVRDDINLYRYVKDRPVNVVDPSGLAGTSPVECTYYTMRCRQSGGSYYCETAQKWCDWFPKPPSPDNEMNLWARCTRKCLQDCDQEQYRQSCPHPGPPGQPDPSTDSFWDWKPFKCHVKCYVLCAGAAGPGAF